MIGRGRGASLQEKQIMRLRVFGRLVDWLMVGFVVGLIAAGCASDEASGPVARTEAPHLAPNLNILIVHSFGPELFWVQQINSVIEREFAEYGYSADAGNFEMKTYFMNVQRAATEGELERMGSGARAYIERNEFDLIFAADDEAVRRVVALAPPEGTPYVFLGLDGRPEDYGLAQHENVAGVLERIHTEEMLAWLLRVKPDADHITFLTDSSSQATGFSTNISLALAESPFADAPFAMVNTFSEWQARVEAAADSDFLVIGSYHSLVDDEDAPVYQADVIAWTLEHSVPPVVGFWEYTVRDGALGGSVISAEVQAQAAVEKAIRILNGEPPATVGIDAPERGKLMLNTSAITHWDLTPPLDLIEISALVE
jgi:hypothetical protein